MEIENLYFDGRNQLTFNYLYLIGSYYSCCYDFVILFNDDCDDHVMSVQLHISNISVNDKEQASAGGVILIQFNLEIVIWTFLEYLSSLYNIHPANNLKIKQKTLRLLILIWAVVRKTAALS
ncbi:hypothetical protein PPL_10481 [Heterostelium album PN500]|uniref:Uncharacterized protein n=1 Tax=Heterostelium pallidum (strain ATCC 26659 / Pp 5 / PN500) TaxID=670386 RepID=D3BR77_HETP5|nr:hypothetical protein PPL_10481 [Heterostelium album PN500]EFA75909.1 hypothetical protein PPL_10481 [Heterostelium album PN500]|eukprot:XP_020428043.1 hypothetical protein PPL_10481 [Heterostelium album PN500]